MWRWDVGVECVCFLPCIRCPTVVWEIFDVVELTRPIRSSGRVRAVPRRWAPGMANGKSRKNNLHSSGKRKRIDLKVVFGIVINEEIMDFF